MQKVKWLVGLRLSWSVGGLVPVAASELVDVVALAGASLAQERGCGVIPGGMQEAGAMKNWRTRWGN